MCAGAGWDRVWLSGLRGWGGREGKEETWRGGERWGRRGISLNTTAAAPVSDPAGLSCYLERWLRPAARRWRPALCPSPRWLSDNQESKAPDSPAAAEHLLAAHLVGLDKAHKHGEEDRGRGRLGALPEVVDHIVEGLLEVGKRKRESGGVTWRVRVRAIFAAL